MSEFKNKVITTKGLELLSKALAGEQIQFTRIEMGSGTLVDDISSVESLIQVRQNLPIASINKKGSQVNLSATLKLDDIKADYDWSEVGVFAKGANDIEVLYMYGYTENTSYISRDSLNEKLISISVMVGSTADITAIIDNSLVYLTRSELDEHNRDVMAHQDIRERMFRTYKRFDEIGCTVKSTIVELAQALNDYEELICSVYDTQSSVYPYSGGTLHVRKINSARVDVQYAYGENLWYGYVDQTTFSGWNRVKEVQWNDVKDKYVDGRGQGDKSPSQYSGKGICIELVHTNDVGIDNTDSLATLVTYSAWHDYTGIYHQTLHATDRSVYTRSSVYASDTWHQWKNLSNADTVDGKHASDLISTSGGTISGAGNGIKFHGHSQNNGIFNTSGDGALIGDGINKTNLAIKSWQGVGFVNGCPNTGVFEETTVAIDCRGGNITAKGNIIANGVNVISEINNLKQEISKAGDIVGKIVRQETINASTPSSVESVIKTYTNEKGGFVRIHPTSIPSYATITMIVDGVTSISSATANEVFGGWQSGGRPQGFLDVPFKKTFTFKSAVYPGSSSSSMTSSWGLIYYLNS